MSKLIVLKGLPASGKTTYAKELVKQGFKRVNKDELRNMVDSGKWSKENEHNIKEIRDIIIVHYLDSGYNVVVDDTNFAPEHMETFNKIAEGCEADLEEIYFNISVLECIKRDAGRSVGHVGSEVIMNMFSKYIEPNLQKPKYDTSLPDAFMFDIDGTLAKMCNRNPYDWSKIDEDSLNESVAHVLDAVKGAGRKIIIVSGRDSICKPETEQWLKDNDIKYDAIFMREVGDKRTDVVSKKEIYDKHINGKYNILGVFDDRNSVVDLWRSLGLTCFQVNWGDF